MIWRKLKQSWHAKQVEQPRVDPELENLNGLTRSVESIRYSILSIEFWISPNGQVREWLRQMTGVASWLAVPAVLVLPLVVLILWQIVKAVTMLVAIAGKMIVFPVLALVAALAILGVINIAKSLFR